MDKTDNEWILKKSWLWGNIKTNKGIFHIVRKRQEDGSWKFVWD